MPTATKKVIFWIWITALVSVLYLYFFKNELLKNGINHVMGAPLAWRYVIYLALGCIRGLTLVPVTYLIILGLVFLPAGPAYILTVAGVMVASASIYYFSDYLGLANFFERTYPKQISKLKKSMAKNELPIVITWSFLPITPTDLICYVCGSLRVDVRKFLLGVFIGEGISCAIYIFAGKGILLFLLHKVIGA
jgi:uncharacterized membrane protein YdjX (TVP38/TMEM64 family)